MVMLMRHGQNASVREIAIGALKLNRGVVDVMAVGQHAPQLVEDGVAGRGRNVCDGDVRGEGVSVTADAPDMEVVDVEHAGDGAQLRVDGGNLHAAGCAFEQNVQTLTHNADRRPEHHAGDADGERRIDPAMAGSEDEPAADDHGSGRERIANFVDQDGAQIQIASAAQQHCRDGSVEKHSGGSHPHHESGLDWLGVRKALDCRVEDQHGNDNQRHGIDEGG